MKIIAEGSPENIRSLFVDKHAGYNEARASLLAEALVKENESLKSQVGTLETKVAAGDRLIAMAEKKASDARDGSHSSKTELGAKNAHIASQDAHIQRLQFEMRAMKERMDNPIRLTSVQEAEIEAVFQEMLEKYSIKPVIFAQPQGAEISASHVFTTIFQILASGDRVSALKEIKAVTGISLIGCRDLLDNALRAYGCTVNDRNSPIAKKNVPVKPLV